MKKILFFIIYMIFKDSYGSELTKLKEKSNKRINSIEKNIKNKKRKIEIEKIKTTMSYQLQRKVFEFSKGTALCCCIPCCQCLLIGEDKSRFDDLKLVKCIKDCYGSLSILKELDTKKSVQVNITKLYEEFLEKVTLGKIEKNLFQMKEFDNNLKESIDNKKLINNTNINNSIIENQKELQKHTENLNKKLFNEEKNITLTPDEKFELMDFLQEEYTKIMMKLEKEKEIRHSHTIKKEYLDEHDHLEELALLKMRFQNEAMKKRQTQDQIEQNKWFIQKWYEYCKSYIKTPENIKEKLTKEEEKNNELIKEIEENYIEILKNDKIEEEFSRILLKVKIERKIYEDFFAIYRSYFKHSTPSTIFTKFITWTNPFKIRSKLKKSSSKGIIKETTASEKIFDCLFCPFFNPKKTIEEETERFYFFYHKMIMRENATFGKIIEIGNNTIEEDSDDENFYDQKLTREEKMDLLLILNKLIILLLKK